MSVYTTALHFDGFPLLPFPCISWEKPALLRTFDVQDIIVVPPREEMYVVYCDVCGDAAKADLAKKQTFATRVSHTLFHAAEHIVHHHGYPCCSFVRLAARGLVPNSTATFAAPITVTPAMKNTIPEAMQGTSLLISAPPSMYVCFAAALQL